GEIELKAVQHIPAALGHGPGDVRDKSDPDGRSRLRVHEGPQPLHAPGDRSGREGGATRQKRPPRAGPRNRPHLPPTESIAITDPWPASVRRRARRRPARLRKDGAAGSRFAPLPRSPRARTEPRAPGRSRAASAIAA